MNQTKKRLSIINLAISITDIETIQLQILKLGLLKSDIRIQEIVTVLQSENYAKAQRLIKIYIDTPMEDILQRASQQTTPYIQEVIPLHKKETIISEEDQKIIDEFQLFTTNNDHRAQQVEKKELNFNEYLDNTSKTPADTQVEDDCSIYDALLHMETDEVTPDNIPSEISQEHNDSFFDIPEKEEMTSPDRDNTDRDTFFDTNDEKEAPSKENSETPLALKRERKTSFPKDALETKIENYPLMSYIRQKFENMKKQYEPIEKSHVHYPTVETFLTTISKDGYKETEIIQTINYIKKLMSEKKFSEAAQLLLVCASTKSKFAQLMLARELYRGIILRKNIHESFTLLTHLAEEDCAEALCDLGQFYEHAISTGKDNDKAEELYQKAMHLGIKRAEKHYARLKKKNKGFFKK